MAISLVALFYVVFRGEQIIIIIDILTTQEIKKIWLK